MEVVYIDLSALEAEAESFEAESFEAGISSGT